MALAPGDAGRFLERPSAQMSSSALLSSYLGVYFEFTQSLNLLWTLDYPKLLGKSFADFLDGAYIDLRLSSSL